MSRVDGWIGDPVVADRPRAGHTLRVPGSRRIALGLAILVAWVPACRGRDPSCPDSLSAEECAFRKAQAKAIREEQARSEADGGGEGGSGPVWAGEADWESADAILQGAADVFAAGLDGESAVATLVERCTEVPNAQDGEAGRSWTCYLTQPPVLQGKEFVLEVGESGIAALSAFDVPGIDSTRIMKAAQLRWASWCIDGEFTNHDAGEQEELVSCALPGGPLLVVARFPQDLGRDMWQVSLTILGAG